MKNFFLSSKYYSFVNLFFCIFIIFTQKYYILFSFYYFLTLIIVFISYKNGKLKGKLLKTEYNLVFIDFIIFMFSFLFWFIFSQKIFPNIDLEIFQNIFLFFNFMLILVFIKVFIIKSSLKKLT